METVEERWKKKDEKSGEEGTRVGRRKMEEWVRKVDQLEERVRKEEVEDEGRGEYGRRRKMGRGRRKMEEG